MRPATAVPVVKLPLPRGYRLLSLLCLACDAVYDWADARRQRLLQRWTTQRQIDTLIRETVCTRS